MRQDFDMIQNFDVQGGPEFGRENLPKLRKALSLAGLDGFLVPHEDEYQNEYLPACNERLMWVSGRQSSHVCGWTLHTASSRPSRWRSLFL